MKYDGVERVKSEVAKNKFAIDRMEQYSRCESVRINGVEIAEGESAADAVINVASAMGVAVAKTNISVSHVLPQRKSDGSGDGNGQGRAGKRNFIAKFVRREVKIISFSISEPSEPFILVFL